jgi:hypothetical protein
MAPLIGLYSPAAQSGKSTLAGGLVSLGYRRLRFAGPLKAMLWAFLTQAGCPTEQTQRMLEGDLKEVPSPYLQGQTPRRAMQTLGTEWGRLTIGPYLWVSAAISAAQKARDAGHPVVFDDVRFPNEAEAVEQAGGIVVRVTRPGQVDWTGHTSEGALEGRKFALDLVNDAPSAEAFAALASVVDLRARDYRL